jgi:hypothetical protein
LESNASSDPKKSLRNDTSASYRETSACFSRDDTAGAGMGRAEHRNCGWVRAICAASMRSIRRMEPS